MFTAPPSACLSHWSPQTHLCHSLQVSACDDCPAAVPAKKALVRKTTRRQHLPVISAFWGLPGVWSVSSSRWQNILGGRAAPPSPQDSQRGRVLAGAPETRPSAAPGAAPASHTPRPAGLSAPPVHSSPKGSVTPGFTPHLFQATSPQPPQGKRSFARSVPPAPQEAQDPRGTATNRSPAALPYLMKISAMRKPMPEPPPVTNATWPLRDKGTVRARRRARRAAQAGRHRPCPPRPRAHTQRSELRPRRGGGALSAPALTPGCRG